MGFPANRPLWRSGPAANAKYATSILGHPRLFFLARPVAATNLLSAISGQPSV